MLWSSVSARMKLLRCGHLAFWSSTAHLSWLLRVWHVIMNQNCLILDETGLKDWVQGWAAFLTVIAVWMWHPGALTGASGCNFMSLNPKSQGYFSSHWTLIVAAQTWASVSPQVPQRMTVLKEITAILYHPGLILGSLVLTPVNEGSKDTSLIQRLQFKIFKWWKIHFMFWWVHY